jgi:hypothetical protein
VQVGSDRWSVVARELEDGVERDECWSVAAAVYPGFDSYTRFTDRRIPRRGARAPSPLNEKDEHMTTETPRERPTPDEWIARFARVLGVEAPDETTTNHLLGVAGTAAHASERTAAPVACYLVGLAGLSPEEAEVLAESIVA